MLSNQFWLGVAAIPTLLAVGWMVLSAFIWIRWWFIHDDGRFHGSKGYHHVADFYDEDSGKWYPKGQHTHQWPPDTPWWLIRLVEPIRVWVCLRGPDHRES